MMKVTLWDMCGAGLIVPQGTGVYYANQVGGGACIQRTLEGIFIPVSQDTQLGDYSSSLESQLMRVFSGVVKMTKIHADQVDMLLKCSELTKGISVDRNRLSDSCEAWVYVDVEETQLSAYQGFGRFKAVLTWPNSD